MEGIIYDQINTENKDKIRNFANLSKSLLLWRINYNHSIDRSYLGDGSIGEDRGQTTVIYWGRSWPDHSDILGKIVARPK